jgi:hypothetical protein
MGNCLSTQSTKKKEHGDKDITKRHSDIHNSSKLTKDRLSLITNKFKIYKELHKMLVGMKDMDGGNGENGRKTGNGIIAKKSLDDLNGVAHT